MANLQQYREQLNLTQQELSDRSGISIRTIQRIEAGTPPKGHTLKALSKALQVEEKELVEEKTLDPAMSAPGLLKLINISSLPFSIFPPLNILMPLLIMILKKEFNPLTRQIVSVQILWTIAAVCIFMLSAFSKNWFGLGNKFTMVVMILLVLSNFFIILRNTAEIDKKQRLFFRLNFSII